MYYLGIDIGGTSIKAGLVDEFGKVHELQRAPTIIDNLDGFLSTVSDLFGRFQGKSIQAAGVGVPGLRSYETRVIETSPNIPCLQKAPLEEMLTKRLGIRVTTENDANAGAYGEWVHGAGRGLGQIAYITIGTGLGCGLILDGKLFRGASGYAGELGHTTVAHEGRPCACGSQGCLETYVSATAMVITAREILPMHPDSELHRLQDAMTAQLIYDAAMRGDAAARAVFHYTGEYLGIACANLMNLLNPQAIVIGGGVIASGDLLLRTATAVAQSRSFGPAAKVCPIVQSHLGPDAGLIGAAMLARDQK